MPNPELDRRSEWTARLPAIVRAPSLYELKKAALAPRAAYLRKRVATPDTFGRAMLELHYYRPTIFAFVAAAMKCPDILVSADLDSESVVIDAGAYIGEWSETISERYGATIHAFEPVPSASKRMQRRLADHPNVHVHKLGLGATNERVTMSVDGPGSSMYASKGVFGSTEVEIRDVVEVFDELGLHEIDLLKVNIEGAEYDLFDRLAEAEWLPHVRVLSVQFHEWHPNAYKRRRTVRRNFRRNHEEVWNFPWVWELWRRK
jgi:FkbM family methyltransferase